MKALPVILFLALLQTACASLTYRNHAQNLGAPSPIGVTTRTDTVLSDDHFTVVDFALENKSDDWIRIKEVQFKIDDAGPFNVVVGSDLNAWIEGKAEELRVRNYNTDLLLGGVSLLSLAAMRSSNNSVAVSGAATLLGTTGFQLFRVAQDGFHSVTTPTEVPTTNLLSESTIAPGQVIRRWLLLQGHPADLPKYGSFKFLTVDAREYEYKVKIHED